MRALEQELHATEEKAPDAKQKAVEELRRRQATVHLLGEANHHCEDAERRVAESENRYREALERAVEAERKVQELITDNGRHRGELVEAEQCTVETEMIKDVIAENGRLQGDLQRTEKRVLLAEQQLDDTVRQKKDFERELEGKTKELAAHNTEVWRIPGRDVFTVRKIGTGGWGAAFEGRE